MQHLDGSPAFLARLVARSGKSVRTALEWRLKALRATLEPLRTTLLFCSEAARRAAAACDPRSKLSALEVLRIRQRARTVCIAYHAASLGCKQST